MLAIDAEPAPVRGRIAANSLWMALSAAVGIAQSVAVTFMMSRYLGLVAFGQLSLIMSCTSVVLFASGSSVANVLRESARARMEGSMVTSAVVAQLVLAAPVLLAALGVLALVSGEPALIGPAATLGVALMLRTALGPVIGFYLGRERMAWQMLDTAQLLVTLAALVAFIALGTGLYALPFASLVGTVAVVIVAAATFGRHLTVGSFRPDRSGIRMLVIPTLLWSGVSLVQQVHWSVEPLLAPMLMDETAVGVFMAGNRLLPAMRSIAAALGLVFLPAFVRAAQSGDMRALNERAAWSLRYLLPAGLALSAGLLVAAPLITMLLYPPEFGSAADVIRRLSASPAALILHWHALCVLFAADELTALLLGYGIALSARVALSTWLGSTDGATGLAIAEAASDWILALTLQIVAFRVRVLRYRSAE